MKSQKQTNKTTEQDFDIQILDNNAMKALSGGGLIEDIRFIIELMKGKPICK